MIEKTLIMAALYKETKNEKGETIIPPFIFKIYHDEGKDCFQEEYISNCKQVYARTNKSINYSRVTVDDFKGKKGIEDNFYSLDSLYKFIEMLIDDGHHIKRVTRHNENELADTLFKYVMTYSMGKTSKMMNF